MPFQRPQRPATRAHSTRAHSTRTQTSLLRLLACLVVTSTLSLSQFGLPQPTFAQSDEGHLYWARHSDSEVWRSTLDGTSAEAVLFEGLLATVIALDLSDGRFYYGHLTRPDDRVDGLYSAELDGTSRALVAAVDGSIRDIELDPGEPFVYWVDEAGVHRVERTGGTPELLVAGSFGRIALDTANEHLYYTAPHPVTPGEDTIRRRTLTSTEDVQIREDYGFIAALEIDTGAGKLYVSSVSGTVGISRIDVDGSNYEQLTSASHRDLELAGGFVYYTESDDLQRMDPDGSNPTPVSSGTDVQAFDLDLTSGRFYSARHSALARYDLDGSNRELLVGVIGSEVHGIAVDGDGERIFAVANSSPNAVLAYPLQGGEGLALLKGGDDPLDSPRGMAWDPATRTLFVANNTSAPEGGVTATDLDDGDVSPILAGVDDVHDVAVDSVRQRIFWTEGIGSGGAATAAIGSADLDGANAITVLASLPTSIRGIAVDSSGEQIFWTDHGADEIWRADLDGGNAAALVTGLDNPHDVAVDPVGGKLYWTEGIRDSDDPTGAIRRCDLDGTDVESVYTGLSASIRELVVVHHRALFLFADGFESGTTGAWSSSTP